MWDALARNSFDVSRVSDSPRQAPATFLHVSWVHPDSNRGLTGYEPVALDR